MIERSENKDGQSSEYSTLLDALREKYPNTDFNHPPNPNCKHCKGTGEKLIKRKGEMIFCICTFVNHNCSDEAGTKLGDFAKRELKKLRI